MSNPVSRNSALRNGRAPYAASSTGETAGVVVGVILLVIAGAILAFGGALFILWLGLNVIAGFGFSLSELLGLALVFTGLKSGVSINRS